jgi:peptidoglycan hydrolase CwlO-like protein
VRRPVRLRIQAALTAAALALLAAVLLLLFAGSAPPARAASVESALGQLGSSQPLQIGLSEQIAADSRRIGALQPGIDRLGAQLDRVEADIADQRARLAEIQDSLALARRRLVELQAALIRDEAVLSRELVDLYKSGNPDWVTVVMSSRGFKDLLERADFGRRLAHRNAQILHQVRLDRTAVKREEAHLQTLEAAQVRAVEALLSDRATIASARARLVSRQSRLVGERRRLRARLARIAGVAAEALSAAGLVNFNGVPVAAWIAPILTYAAAHGWNGHLVQFDGFRTYGDQVTVSEGGGIAAAPGRSRHEGTQWPDGAIDIPDDAPNFNRIVNAPGSPFRGQLQWRAPEGDPVHFSSPAPVAGKGY